MNAQRKLLDSLLGTNRNGVVNTGPKKSFNDPDVCKYHLVGLCPYEIFLNTKADIGDCGKLHSSPLRRDFFEAKKDTNFGYEEQLENFLEKLVTECDKKIEKCQQRLDENQNENQRKRDEISLQIVKLCKEAERLGEEGQVDESLQLLKEADELKQKRTLMMAETEAEQQQQQQQQQVVTVDANGQPQTQQQQKRLRVCEVCGAYLSIYDSDKRLSDHFGGRLHMGYRSVRDKLFELQHEKPLRENLPKFDFEEDRKKGRRSSERQSHPRSRSRSRSRSPHSRSHSRSRSRSPRHSHRHERRDRHRSSHRNDRDKNRSRHKH